MILFPKMGSEPTQSCHNGILSRVALGERVHIECGLGLEMDRLHPHWLQGSLVHKLFAVDALEFFAKYKPVPSFHDETV
jgi:hypothetical protein